MSVLLRWRGVLDCMLRLLTGQGISRVGVEAVPCWLMLGGGCAAPAVIHTVASKGVL